MQQKGIGEVEVIFLERPVKHMLELWPFPIEIENVKEEISESFG